MSTLLVTGIGELTTWDDERPVRSDAAVLLDDGIVAWTGDSRGAPDADERLDVDGAAVIPGFVDSHTHLMFAGDRADEFAARMAGEAYTAGGIQRTVRATRAASDDELLTNARRLLAELRAQGTTTVEIKSGYGLTVDDEARALRLARTLTSETTFLGAHVVPQEYADDRDGYLDLVTGPMLDACAPHARWIDVFCDRGAFTVEESRRVLEAGIARGLGARLHGAQLEPSAAVELAVGLGAASVDHATFLTDRDIELLAGSSTVATLLPGAEFSTRQPYPSSRRLLDAGVTIALATDCNPGSSFTTSMPFCVALAVREMGLTVPEALRAATLGGAAALRRHDVGHLRPGAIGGLVVLDAPSAVHLAYRPGVPLIRLVVGGLAV